MSSVVEEFEPIASAVREAFGAAGYEPGAPELKDGRPLVRPAPLERMLAGKGIARIEVANLTRASAAAELRAWGLERPDLLEDPTPLAGLLFVTPGGGCVLVRQDDPLPRRRFSAAHELGHFLLHYRPEWLNGEPDLLADDEPELVVEGGPDGGGADGKPLEALEREANRFAADLLMPAEVCRGLHAFYSSKYGDAPRYIEGHIATDLLVSRQAVRYRLKDLGLSG